MFTTGTQAEAVKAESRSYVSVPGAYIGIIKSATLKTFASGAAGLEVEITTEAGGVRDMIITKKKDGTASEWGVNKIQGGLMRVIGLAEGQSIQPQAMPDGTTVFPDLLGKRVGVCINIEKTGTLAKSYENTRIDSFYNPDTNQTGSGRDIAEITPTLKVTDSVVKTAPVNAPNASLAGTPAPATNPFAS